MLANQVFRIIIYGLGVGSISAVIWTMGPYVAFGDWHPLDNYIIRDVLIALLCAAAGSVGGWKFWKRRKNAKQLADAMAGGEEAPGDREILQARMKDALGTLKNASRGSATYLYDLPWYLLIGPPGAGKTTALVNSGLKFPLTKGGSPAAVAGTGGTRYCDWWFTEDAVLIDTAGRYTTQDSDAKTDQKSWFAFLDILKKSRPKQPINGVLLAISVEDVLTSSEAELTAHASAIRTRLLELHTRLKVDFPVYAVLTKTDLLLGFIDYFQNLDNLGRSQVFGATFQTDDKRRNMIEEVPAEFDLLVESLNVDMLDRLQDEPAPATRVQLYGFPAQLAALKQPLYGSLNQIFEPTRYHANATLRGFYFTSGTQEGTPLDQLIGALERSFGTVEVPPTAYSGKGRSFFLTDLIQKVIIGEASWVSTDKRAVRRALILKAAAYSVLVLISATLAGLWWVSYGRNRALIDQTVADVDAYTTADHGLSKQQTVGDRDLAKVLPPLGRLRNLPAGYAERGMDTPVMETFGLSQRSRLHSAALTSYHNGLEGLFRPRLVYRLEEILDNHRDQPDVIYPALKAYKMLGGLHKVDEAFVLDWERRDWAENLYQASGNEAGRAALEDHLKAMFALNEDEKPRFALSGPLVEQSEATLGQLSIAQRAYQLLKSQAIAPQSDWILVRRGGLQLASVFDPAGAEPLQSIRVPYFYTYDGFHKAFIARLGAIKDQIEKERWVLGDIGKQSGFGEQYQSLASDLMQVYQRDFIAAWQAMLGKIRLKRLANDKSYVALTSASGVSSPVKQLFQAVVDETTVTRPVKQDGQAGDAKPELDPSVSLQEGSPGSGIEDAFRGYRDMLAGDPGTVRPIDQLLKILGNIATDLKRQAASPSDRPQLNGDLGIQVSDLRNFAPSLPTPFSGMMQGAAAEFDNEAMHTTVTLLSQSLVDVTRDCKAAVDNHYPFARSSDREMGLADFGQVFGPNGSLKQYFDKNLAKYVDRSRRDWAWNPGDPVARTLSPALLRSFQLADQIRQAFFAAGGLTPSFNLTIMPPAIADPTITADVVFYGTEIMVKQGNSAPRLASWPGAGNYEVKLSLKSTPMPAMQTASNDPTMPPQPPPDDVTLIDKQGVWAVFHLLEEAGRGGNAVSFFSGGQNYRFQFTSAAGGLNPLNLSALRQFQCPSG